MRSHHEIERRNVYNKKYPAIHNHEDNRTKLKLENFGRSSKTGEKDPQNFLKTFAMRKSRNNYQFNFPGL